MSKSTNRWAIVIGATVLLAMGLFLVLPSLDAAVQVAVCTGSKDHLILVDDKLFHIKTDGFLAAGIGETFRTPDGSIGTNLTVDDVFSEGFAEGLGSVTFKLDAERTAAEGLKSGVVGNVAGKQFPATQTMRFHFTADIEGKQFRSADPAVVVSTCVDSLPPKDGTVYNLAEDVRIVGEDGSTLTLQSGKAFTAGG